MTAADKIAKTPKRIWLDSDSFNGSVGFVHPKAHAKAHWPAYVRADLADALAQENAKLRSALEHAADDLRIIQTLNSHGASDRSYINALRINAQGAEMRARATLSPTPSPENAQ